LSWIIPRSPTDKGEEGRDGRVKKDRGPMKEREGKVWGGRAKRYVANRPKTKVSNV